MPRKKLGVTKLFNYKGSEIKIIRERVMSSLNPNTRHYIIVYWAYVDGFDLRDRKGFTKRFKTEKDAVRGAEKAIITKRL